MYLVDLTTNGVEMMQNFLKKICCFECKYTMENREENCIKKIREAVGNKDVLVNICLFLLKYLKKFFLKLMVSGGVDSTVCAALLNRALGSDKLYAIHIDNGFMRYQESDKVVASLNKLGLNVRSKFFF